MPSCTVRFANPRDTIAGLIAAPSSHHIKAAGQSMNHQEIKEFLDLYVRINAEIAGITETISDLKGRKKLIEEVLSEQVPENFVFQSKGIFYRLEMDVEDGGVLHFEKIEFFDDGLHETEPITKAGPEITIETLPRDQKTMKRILGFLEENGPQLFEDILEYVFSNVDFLSRDSRESWKIVDKYFDCLIGMGRIAEISNGTEMFFSYVKSAKKEED